MQLVGLYIIQHKIHNKYNYYLKKYYDYISNKIIINYS